MGRPVTAVLAAVLVAAIVLAGQSAAHYPSIAYRPPAVGPDGDLYVAGGAGYLYALDPGGSPVWSHRVGAEPTDRPAVHRGVVAVPTVDGRVVAAAAAGGDRAWAASAGDRRGRYRVATAGPAVYVAGPGGVTALAVADGATRWSTTLPRRVVAGPVEAGGRVVVATGRGDDARLVALDAGGDVSWRVPLAGDVRALAADGDRVLVAAGDAVHGVDEEGDRRWRVRTGEVSGLSPAPGGAVVGTYDGRVVRVRGGAAAWRAAVDAPAAAPAPGPAGRWVYAVTPGAVVGVRGGEVRWRTPVGMTVLAPPAVADRVYVGTQVNRTYALDRDGSVAWINRYATPVGTAPGVDHEVSAPAFLADAAGSPTRVVRTDGTARELGGPLDPRWLAVLGVAVLLAAGGVAAGRRWRGGAG